MTNKEPLLEIKDLKVHFRAKGGSILPWGEKTYIKAVNGVSLTVYEGETLGIVGESGCGKSTLARAVVGLNHISGGSVIWRGQDLAKASHDEWHAFRKEIQMIFQDPLASLNPRMTIGEIIEEPLCCYYPEMTAQQRKEKAEEMMALVGLLQSHYNRYPHEFSGGQCQRVGIARALILDPKLVVCDEAVSALDVSIRSQIVNLLKDLQKKLNLSLIFIAHDLGVVHHMSDRTVVMYLGRVMETIHGHIIGDNKRHPYTEALLSAIPKADPDKSWRDLELLEGELPSVSHPPEGCVFCTRCPLAQDICHKTPPPVKRVGYSDISCHFA